jgi:hypothetical protein
MVGVKRRYSMKKLLKRIKAIIRRIFQQFSLLKVGFRRERQPNGRNPTPCGWLYLMQEF